MNRKIKKTLIYALSFIGFSITVIWLISYFNQDRVRNIAVQQLNKLLDTEVRVKEINFSLLRKFPRASVEFRSIEILEKSPLKEKKNLISAKSLFLEFDPFDLITGNYVIDRIHIDKAVINITYFRDGSENFDFFKTDSVSDDFQISLRSVQISGSTLNYNDMNKGDLHSAFVNDLKMNGEFEREKYDLSVSARGKLLHFRSDAFAMNRKYPFVLDLTMDIDKSAKHYSLEKTFIQLGTLAFAFEGRFQNTGEGLDLDLSFQSQNLELSALSEILPDKLRKKFDEFEAEGNLSFRGKIHGISGGEHFPSVEISYVLIDGSLDHRERKRLKAEKVSFRGRFTNGNERNLRTSAIEVDSIAFTGRLGESQGRFSIVNFEDPHMEFRVSTKIDLSGLRDLLANDTIESLKGKCILDLSLNTRLDSLASMTLSNLKSAEISGELIVENASIKTIHMPYELQKLNGKMHFSGNNIIIDSMSGSVEKNDFSISGKLQNFIPYLLDADEKLNVNASLHSPKLDLNTLFPKLSESNEGELPVFPISETISLELMVEASDFTYRKFHADNVKAQLKSRFPLLLLQNLEVAAMEGTFTGWIQFEVKNPTETEINSHLNLKHVNISTLFEQFENFGQSSIVAANLKGYALVDMDFSSMLDEKMQVNADKTFATGHVEIDNGELVNYEPVLALSKYVDVEELQHIKFFRLTNDIEVRDRWVYIPDMEVKSSALELRISGKHSFDNLIEYHFQLWLSDFLFRKAKRTKKNQTEFGEIEADESGRARLFMRMEGTTEDYKIRLDRKALRDKWGENLREERSELKDLFREEFKGEKRDRDVAPLNFEIEWEEVNSNKSTPDSINEKAKKEKNKGDKTKNSWLKKLGKQTGAEYEEYDAEKFD